jgi:hypothetical protein
MQAEADELGAILGRPFHESWTHARVVVQVWNDGPYDARDVDVMAMRPEGAPPSSMSGGAPVRLRPVDSAEFRAFEAWECTYEIGTSGGIAHAEAITRWNGARPSETVGIYVTTRGFPPLEIALPAEAFAAEGRFHYLSSEPNRLDED